MQTIRITTSQNIDIDYEVAGVGERLLARLIDFGVFFVIYLLAVIGFLIVGKSLGEGTTLTVILIVYGALFVFYDLICEVAMGGRSIGKLIMKIKVISIDGGRPSFGQYLMRWLFRIVDFTLSMQLCGLLCVAISEKQQRLGDMVAGTTLIKTKPRVLKHNLVFAPMVESYQPTFKDLYRLNDNDVTLIQEVVRNYTKTGNTEVVLNASARVKEILGITSIPEGMNELRFLQIVIQDYNHTAIVNDLQLNS